MGKHGDSVTGGKKGATATAGSSLLASIGPELAAFVSEFIESPEIFFSMSCERRREIEEQMDAILFSMAFLSMSYPPEQPSSTIGVSAEPQEERWH